MVTKSTPIRVISETNFRSLLDEAAKGPLLLERDGELFRLAREDDIAYEPDPERVLKTLDETVGGWADLDIDKIIAEIYEARRAGSQPPDRPQGSCSTPIESDKLREEVGSRLVPSIAASPCASRVDEVADQSNL